MRLFPGHTYADVMNMPALVFFSLLKEGTKQEVEDWKFQATIAMAPEMKSNSWKRFSKELEKLSENTDILEEEPHEVSIEKLKQIFGQK